MAFLFDPMELRSIISSLRFWLFFVFVEKPTVVQAMGYKL